MTFNWFRHPPPSSAPPNPAFIRKLDLHIRYTKGRPPVSTATLTWTPPTTRTDGSALPPDQIAGADIFDTAAPPTPNPTPIGSVIGAAGTFMTGVLSVGTHNFTVVTRDTTGHSSAASNIASLDVPATQANPSAVSDLMATLNP